jgi:hypothetical protein
MSAFDTDAVVATFAPHNVVELATDRCMYAFPVGCNALSRWVGCYYASMAGEELKQFNIYLAAELIKRVKHHAVDTEQSLSAIVAAALEEYLRSREDD